MPADTSVQRPRTPAARRLVRLVLVLAVLLPAVTCQAVSGPGSLGAAVQESLPGAGHGAGCDTAPAVAVTSAGSSACRPPSPEPLPPGLLAAGLASALAGVRVGALRASPLTAPARMPSGRRRLLAITIIRV